MIDLFDKVIVLGRDSGRVGRLAFYGTPGEARQFFGKDSMEGIVMCVNRQEEGGEGKADYYIAKYAELTALKNTALTQTPEPEATSAAESAEAPKEGDPA